MTFIKQGMISKTTNLTQPSPSGSNTADDVFGMTPPDEQNPSFAPILKPLFDTGWPLYGSPSVGPLE